MTLDEVRRISIETTTPGADTATAQLQKLAASESGVAVASSSMSKETLSAQAGLDRMRMSTDSAYRSMTLMAKAQKTIQAGYEQGLLGVVGTSEALAEQGRLLDLASEKYAVTGESSKGMFLSMSEGVKGLVGGFGLLALIDELTKIPSRIIDVVQSVAEIGHMADTIGTSTKELQELQYAGAQFGIGTDDMNSALMRFSKNLGDAQRGTGALNDILKANHVALSGDFKTDFLNYANLVENATTAEQKNYLTTTAFGKSAEQTGLMFNNGAAGVQAYADQADRIGGVVDDDKIRKMEEFNKGIVDIGTTLSTTFKADIVDALTYLSTFVDKLEAAQLSTHNWLVSHFGVVGDAGYLSGPASGNANDNLHDVNLGGLPAQPGKPTVTPNTAQDSLQKQFDSATKSAQAETQAIQDQIATFGLGVGAAAAYTMQQKLMDKAAEDGIALTPKLKASIDDIAKAYGDATEQLQKMKDAQEAQQFLAQSLFDAVNGANSLSDAFKKLAGSIAQAVEQALLLGTGPLAGIFGTTSSSGGLLGSLLGGLLGIKASANGNAFDAGSNVIPFARGGIVDHPTLFKFASGTGLMGEAGPEAIMPLKRGANGQLGVQMVAANSNSRGSNVSVSVAINSGGGEDPEALATAASALVKKHIKDALTAENRALPDKVYTIMRNPRRRGTAALPAALTGSGR